MSDSPHKQIRKARIAQHLSQKQLGERVGCSQSSISHFESGEPNVLSNEIVAKLERELGLSATSQAATEPNTAPADALVFCPNYDCPVALTVVTQGRLVIRPVLYRLTDGGAAVHCKICGSLLEQGCRSCLSPIVDGASCCFGCGEPLVMVPGEAKPADAEQHAQTMAARVKFYLETRQASETLPRPILQNSKPRPASV